MKSGTLVLLFSSVMFWASGPVYGEPWENQDENGNSCAIDIVEQTDQIQGQILSFVTKRVFDSASTTVVLTLDLIIQGEMGTRTKSLQCAPEQFLNAQEEAKGWIRDELAKMGHSFEEAGFAANRVINDSNKKIVRYKIKGDALQSTYRVGREYFVNEFSEKKIRLVVYDPEAKLIHQSEARALDDYALLNQKSTLKMDLYKNLKARHVELGLSAEEAAQKARTRLYTCHALELALQAVGIRVGEIYNYLAPAEAKLYPLLVYGDGREMMPLMTREDIQKTPLSRRKKDLERFIKTDVASITPEDAAALLAGHRVGNAVERSHGVGLTTDDMARIVLAARTFGSKVFDETEEEIMIQGYVDKEAWIGRQVRQVVSDFPFFQPDVIRRYVLTLQGTIRAAVNTTVGLRFPAQALVYDPPKASTLVFSEEVDSEVMKTRLVELTTK
ncbi:MAG: hypothetical protein HY459_02515 [Parcubacteria group bacterium]|nr:hypothetical protein [Parcubacteria group bacterium]